MKTKHITIKGKVQGVFYRVTAKKIADSLNIKGWVKNTKDGHVEVVASGDDASLDEFIQWCNIGPKGADVLEVLVNDHPTTKFVSFDILRHS